MSKELFLHAWAETGRAEGGYVNDPSDSGDATRYGITERVARRKGYTGDMRYLPRKTAEAIAKSEYWDVMQLDEIAYISPAVAKEMFDTGFNTGTRRAVTFLQRSLNALNRREKDYEDISTDGEVGKKTILALRTYCTLRTRNGKLVLLRALNGLQLAFSIGLVERRDKDERFLYGWILNRVS